MDVNFISNAAAATDLNSVAKKDKEAAKVENSSVARAEGKTDSGLDTEAATYEKSSALDSLTTKNAKVSKNQNTEMIEKMKADAAARTKQLRDLVEKLILKQGEKIADAFADYNDDEYDYIKAIRDGKVTVDEETSRKAKEDIADDGYCGVEQTSDRMVDYAKALIGNDKSKADLMMDAINKGYEGAADIWGGDLPEICQQTLDAAMDKLTAWRDEE